MSAYICNPEHIGLLAAYATGPERPGIGGACVPYDLKRQGVVGPGDVAYLLMAENVRSVAARYSGEPIESLPGPGGTLESLQVAAAWSAMKYLAAFPAGMSAVALAKLVQCYEYQICDMDNYETSLALAMCNSMVREILCSMPGYDGANWTWREPEGGDE